MQKQNNRCDCEWSYDMEGPYLEQRCQLCDTITGEEERASKKPWLVANRKLNRFLWDIGQKHSDAEHFACIERMCAYIRVIAPLTGKVPRFIAVVNEKFNKWKNDPDYAPIHDLLTEMTA